jgi:hypothetical protein
VDRRRTPLIVLAEHRDIQPNAHSTQAMPRAVNSWASLGFDLAAPTSLVLPHPAARYSSAMATK